MALALLCASLMFGCEPPERPLDASSREPSSPAWQAYYEGGCAETIKLANGKEHLRLRATLYREGRCVPKNWGLAAKLFKEAFDAGDAAAGIELGWLYDQKHHDSFYIPYDIDPEDPSSEKAERYYKAARDGANTSAENKRRARFYLMQLYMGTAVSLTTANGSDAGVCPNLSKGAPILRDLLNVPFPAAVEWHGKNKKELDEIQAFYECGLNLP